MLVARCSLLVARCFHCSVLVVVAAVPAGSGGIDSLRKRRRRQQYYNIAKCMSYAGHSWSCAGDDNDDIVGIGFYSK